MGNIYFIRHCHVDYTPQGKERDHSHLSQDGWQQAIELKKKLQASGLKFDAVYVSDRVRAAETMTPYVLEEDMQCIKKESLTEVKTKVNGAEYMQETKKNMAFKAPGGESSEEGFDRYHTCVLEIAQKHKDTDVVIVSHGIILRIWLHKVFGIDMFDFPMTNPDVFKVMHMQGQFLSYEKMPHLVPDNYIQREHS